ncbi:MAG: 2-oxo acid dehydrogenase subunit E2 [Opitutaceae bacterium]|nr:2-oxo acid dehydrogenase subunit E2 [Cytophagales bacterium]
MAEVIKMPKMSDTMTEGTIASWAKKVGDTVKAGDVLAEVETDKATMELESYEAGTLLYIGVKEKDSVPVDAIIAIIGKAGEDISSLINGNSGGSIEKQNTPIPPDEKSDAIPANVEGQKDTSGIEATVIRMPKMSDTMTEGVIVAWHKKVGDKVKSGELLAEVETDKATMELESYEDGTLLYIGIEAGKAVPVDGIIAVVGKEGVDYKPLLSSTPPKNGQAASKEDKPQEVKVAASVTQPVAVSSNGDSRVKISPLAKALAEGKGIDIKSLAGSGENGRIVKRDIDSYNPSTSTSKETQTSSSSAPVISGQESFEEVPVTSMRKVIARALGESLFTAPHFSLVIDVDMDKAMEARKSINEYTEAKVSFNDMVIKATAVAIRKHPKVNGSWLGDKIRYNNHIHIGVAVAVEDGLVVPVVRFADSMSLTQISSSVKDLGGKAKNKKLQPKDMEGSTFTISNLGMFGIESFSSIINQPNVCIISVGAIRNIPVVKEGQIVPGNRMSITLTSDHRVVDGAVGAQFLQTLKALIEDPIRILA